MDGNVRRWVVDVTDESDERDVADALLGVSTWQFEGISEEDINTINEKWCMLQSTYQCYRFGSTRLISLRSYPCLLLER